LTDDVTRPLWQPTPAGMAASNLQQYMARMATAQGKPFADYDALWQWSVDAPETFWTSIWQLGQVIGSPGAVVAHDLDKMPGTHWFPEARLNFAENLLRQRGPGTALVAWDEAGQRRVISHDQLYQSVAAFAAALRAEGIVAGDRVAAYMPNLPETVIAMLAAASLGAIFTSASPDFGVQGVVDRFGQTAPKVLVACDGYYYGGKTVDVLGKLGEIVGQLPSVKRVVVVPYVHRDHDHRTCRTRAASPTSSRPSTSSTTSSSRSCPSTIRSTSCTPRAPPACPSASCMRRRRAAAAPQGAQLHGDVKPGDRLFYFTTCGWMMWNWLVSALAAEATLLLYDGSPFAGGNRSCSTTPTPKA
jgi:acetoacetyl-CoA synthetase